MSNCININHHEVRALSLKMGIQPGVMKSMIAVWQEKNNNFDRFPTAEELKDYHSPERIAGIKIRNQLEIAPDVLIQQSIKIEELKNRFDIEMEDWTRQHILSIMGIAGENKSSKDISNELLQNVPWEQRELLKQVIKHLGQRRLDLPLDENGVQKTVDTATTAEYFAALRAQKISRIFIDENNPHYTINPETLEAEYNGNRETYFGLRIEDWFEKLKAQDENLHSALLENEAARKRAYNQYLLDMKEIHSLLAKYPTYLDFLNAPFSTGINVATDLKTMAHTLGNMQSRVAADFIGNEVRELIFNDFLLKEIKNESLNPFEDAEKEYSMYMANTTGEDAYQKGDQFNHGHKIYTLSQKDIKNPHVQMAANLVEDKTTKARIDSNLAVNKLKTIELAIKDEQKKLKHGGTDDCIKFVEGKSIFIWKSEEEQANLTYLQREFIKTCKELFTQYGYDSDVIPSKHQGFWDTFFSDGFFKRLVSIKNGNLKHARENALYNRTPYDKVSIRDSDGVLRTIGEHREVIIKKYNKKLITLKQARKQMDDLLKLADKMKVDDDGKVVYRPSNYDISTQFGNLHDRNSVTDLNSVVNNFIKAQIFKFYVDPIIPLIETLRDRANVSEFNANGKGENYIVTWFDKYMDAQLKKGTKDNTWSKAMTAMVNGLIAWTAYRSLGVNPYAMVGNLAAGYANNLAQLGAGVVLRGHKRLMQDPKKFINLVSRLGVVSSIIDESYNLTSKNTNLAKEIIFATSEKPEWLMQGVAAVGMLSEKQWNAYWTKDELEAAKAKFPLDKFPNSGTIHEAQPGDIKTNEKGELNTDALSEAEKRRMLHIIQRIHGAYHSSMKRGANRATMMKPFMMFKTWMFETYLLFFGNYGQEGTIRNGIRIKSIKNTVQTLTKDKKGVKDIAGALIKMQGTIKELQEKDPMQWTQADKDNIKKIRNYAIIIGAALLVRMAGDDDEDDKSLKNRTIDNILTFGVNLTEKAVTVISPVLPLIWDIITLAKDLVTAKKYESGPHDGKLRFPRDIIDITPGKSLINIVDPKVAEKGSGVESSKPKRPTPPPRPTKP